MKTAKQSIIEHILETFPAAALFVSFRDSEGVEIPTPMRKNAALRGARLCVGIQPSECQHPPVCGELGIFMSVVHPDSGPDPLPVTIPWEHIYRIESEELQVLCFFKLPNQSPLRGFN